MGIQKKVVDKLGTENRSLAAILACRNSGTRLFGKPMQRLDIDGGITIVEHLVRLLRSLKVVDEVVLAISEGEANTIFCVVARELGIPFVIGSEKDVLARMIQAAHSVSCSDVLRITSESPFPYFSEIEAAWERHVDVSADATFLDDVVDGCGFEIVTVSALEKSHREGNDSHRSEFCTRYIRENRKSLRVVNLAPPVALVRRDLRLTVDYPEDLVLCREVYGKFKHKAPLIDPCEVVRFLDTRPDLVNLTTPFVEAGYASMYL